MPVDAPPSDTPVGGRPATDVADLLSAPPSARAVGGPRARGSAAEWLAGAALPVAVGGATVVLRALTAAGGPTDWDSAQYAAGVLGFDVAHGRPQPPGYWLYVECGRLLHEATGLGVVHSLVIVAAVASGAAAGVTALAGRDLAGTWVGLAAGAVVATSPFAWFSGSIVSTYSFDALACAVLVDLAWRARPGSWHGVAAVATLGILAGFRQSAVESFLLLALIPVAAATRRPRQVAATVGAAAASVLVWFVPMALEQPGGAGAWWRATRTEAAGAAHSTSVLDHAPGGATNLGTLAAYTVVALAPLAVLTLASAAVLGLRRRRGTLQGGRHGRRPAWRPWYQRRWAVLGAAVLPPAALVALLQFAKGGYLLAYLPAAVLALLLPLDALVRTARQRASGTWLVAASVGVAAVCLLGAQRFLDGAGVLPASWTSKPGAPASGLWLRDPRYQAPYPDTRAAVLAADARDRGLRALRPLLRPGRDVLLLDVPDGGGELYRDAGWELPHARLLLLEPGQVLYAELGGSLYYPSGRDAQAAAVGPGGSAFLLASPALPGLDALTRRGGAVPVALPLPVGDYRLWRVPPGQAVLGVPVVATAGTRPLGGGIS